MYGEVGGGSTRGAGEPEARRSLRTAKTVGRLRPAVADPSGDPRAPDPAVAAPPILKDEEALIWAQASPGLWVADNRRIGERHPLTGDPIWENRVALKLAHRKLGSLNAAAGFPRFAVVVYDTSTGEAWAHLTDDEARCDAFARARGVLGLPGPAMAREVGLAPRADQLASIGSARAQGPLLNDLGLGESVKNEPRPSLLPVGCKARAMKLADALGKNYHLTLGALRAAHLQRTFGSVPNLPLRAVVLSRLAEAPASRVAAIRFCVECADAAGSPPAIFAPPGEEEDVARLARVPRARVLALPGPGPEADALRDLVLTRDAVGWCEGAGDQDVALRMLVKVGIAGTVTRCLAAERDLVDVMSALAAVATATGCPARAYADVPLAAAEAVARRAAGNMRDKGATPTERALRALGGAVARPPAVERLNRFGRIERSDVEACQTGLGWLAAEARRARSAGFAHVEVMLDPREAHRIAMTLQVSALERLVADAREWLAACEAR